MRSAQLGFLYCKPKAQPFPYRGPHAISLMPEHDDSGAGIEGVGGPQNMFDQW